MDSPLYTIVRQVTQQLPDRMLAEAVENAFQECLPSLHAVESYFQTLTSRRWAQPVPQQFLHGWRDTHLSAGSVAAMTCRLLTLAEEQPEHMATYTKAATENAKIIHEDLGLDGGDTHANLYVRLANTVCGSNEWELNTYRTPAAYEFRKWIHQRRVLTPALEQGLLTTIASEIYNHAEYTLAAPLFEKWLQQDLGISAAQTKQALAYIVVHTGDTESDHFLHGVNALQHYLAAQGRHIDYAQVQECCVEYLQRIGRVFETFSAQFDGRQELKVAA